MIPTRPQPGDFADQPRRGPRRSLGPLRRAPAIVTIRSALLSFLLAALPVAAQEGLKWRPVDPENLVFIGMTEGEIVIELNPAFAPLTVKRFKELVAADFYRGLSFYRVIDGFVAQAGNESDIAGLDGQPRLPPEFERPRDRDTPWTLVQRDDPFAEQTGFVDGFAAARADRTEWLVHCPGVVAMARGIEPDSGSTDFYIVIGQAPRYLDRNLTIFGRVIDGMEVVQRIRRGEASANGIIENELARSRIGRIRMARELLPEERRSYYVMDTNSSGFERLLKARRDRDEPFFVNRPPRVLDICQVPVGTRFVQGRAP